MTLKPFHVYFLIHTIDMKLFVESVHAVGGHSQVEVSVCIVNGILCMWYS